MTIAPSLPVPYANPHMPLTRPTVGRLLLRSRLVQVGAVLVALLTLLAVAAPLLAPYRMEQQFSDGLNDDGMPVGPCLRFPLGTDGLGRDVCSRLLYGARISLTVGVVAMLTAVVLGTLVGLCAGYFGGGVGMLLMRFTDIMMAVPPLLLALTLAGLLQEKREIPWLGFTLERGLTSVFIVIGIVSWTGIARVVRVGERVWCFGAQSYRPFGTAAEYVVVPAGQAVPLRTASRSSRARAWAFQASRLIGRSTRPALWTAGSSSCKGAPGRSGNARPASPGTRAHL
jgi:hypothetical protein